MGTPPKGKSPRSLTKMETSHLDICDRFRMVRLELKLTAEQMAERLGLTTSYVKSVENRYFTPNLFALKAMHREFGYSYEWLIEGKGRQKK